MNYYLDTEFLEGPQNKTLLGFKYGETKPTIDLISIGIVSEDNREYYAISKEFNLKEAWNRHDLKINKRYPLGPEYNKVYWLRENVLKPIWKELFLKDEPIMFDHDDMFTYNSFKYLINKYGKTNKEIANEIVVFIYGESDNLAGLSPLQEAQRYEPNLHIDKPKFYANYCSYDWVVFCWIFGKMIDLPKGFPMYCNDLQQVMETEVLRWKDSIDAEEGCVSLPLRQAIQYINNDSNYPVNKNPHHALSDAKFDKDLHEFLKKI